MTNIVLSLIVLAAIALIAGAFVLWRRTGEIRQPALMVLLAAIAIGNLLLWTVPIEDSASPVEMLSEDLGDQG